MRLQGENGLMRTKFTSMAAERQQLKGEIAALANGKQDLVQARACPLAADSCPQECHANLCRMTGLGSKN